MRENNSGFKIDESQRQSWLSIAAVWAGGMICVPCLMIGGVLAGGGLSLGQIVLSILIGYGLICVYMICIGMQACDTGLPVSMLAKALPQVADWIPNQPTQAIARSALII